MSEVLLRDVVVLVLANKQDLPHAETSDRVADAMGLRALSKHKWFIQPCSASTGEGLNEGLEWLHTTLRAKKK